MINNAKSLYFNLYKNNFYFLVFLFIFLGLALNSIFNSISAEFGRNYPYSTFLYNPNDLFADYFKFIFSYPGWENIKIDRNYETLLDYLLNNPFRGKIEFNELTNLHVPPLTTLFCLLNVWVMKNISPIILYSILIFTYAFLVNQLTSKVCKLKLDGIFLMVSFLISYPTIFFITRGNIYAGINGLLLICYIFFLNINKTKTVPMLLLSIAVNLRPNAIIFALGMLIKKFNIHYYDFIKFTILTSGIFLASLYLSHILYPDYNVSNFLSALKIYYQKYAIGNNGLAFGSSILGLEKILFNFRYISFFEIFNFFTGAILTIIAVYLLHVNRISNAAYFFLLSAIYALFSGVFADYHLLIFFAPIILLYNSPPVKLESIKLNPYQDQIIFLASLLLLIPKNYFYFHGYSVQVLLNPIILCVSMALLIKRSF